MNKRLEKEKTLLGSALEYEAGNTWHIRSGTLLVECVFPESYPFHAPSIRILEPVGILPRAGICGCLDGTLCVSGFLSDWSPQWNVTKILERIHHFCSK
jgi:ubiquitin-protein ligase